MSLKDLGLGPLLFSVMWALAQLKSSDQGISKNSPDLVNTSSVSLLLVTTAINLLLFSEKFWIKLNSSVNDSSCCSKESELKKLFIRSLLESKSFSKTE